MLGGIQYNQVVPSSIDPSVWGIIDHAHVGEAVNDDITIDEVVDFSSQNIAEEAAVQLPVKVEASENLAIKSTGDKTLYVFYAKSIGLTFCAIWLLLSICYVGGSTAPQIWLRFWTQGGTSSQKGLHAGVYAAFSIWGVVSAAAAVGFFLVFIIPKSAHNLHKLLLTHVLSAPFYFSVHTDNGTILNRFSQDMSQVDQVLPISAVQTGFEGLGILAQLGVIASGATYVAIAFPFGFAVLWVIQAYYLRTSRQIRQLDLECKAPLYTDFTETLAGLATVRSFVWQPALLSNCLQHLDTSQKAYYLMFCLQRWLNVVLDLFAGAMAVLLVGIALNLPGSTSRSAMGLAMVNLIDLNTNLSNLIIQWTNLEVSLGALARLRTFIDQTPQENLDERSCRTPPPGWPIRGELEFDNVIASYSPDSRPVLRNVSLKVKPGQKIGICGRTGSGKSSLLLALLRMLELNQGSIRIDGLDLADLPRQSIRSSLHTLPQDPIALFGTVRQNLNPEEKSSFDDPMLETALTKVGLLATVLARGGLEADYTSMGFSTGEQQLFCLARATLRKSRVVLLDEAMSAVDQAAEERMRTLILEEFKLSTVVEIVHRLDIASGYDMVIVMDGGKVAEMGPPRTLLSTKSRFKELCEGS